METKSLFPGKLVSTILASVRPLALVDHLDVTLEVPGGVEVVATGSANVVFALVDTPAKKFPRKGRWVLFRGIYNEIQFSYMTPQYSRPGFSLCIST